MNLAVSDSESDSVSEPALIGIDWGTSSFRAFLINTQGKVLERLCAPEGIMHVPGGDFDAAFERLLSPWTKTYQLPVIASGMITSRNGWVETPYVNAPTGVDGLAKSLVEHKTKSGTTVCFVTGMTISHGDVPDVMRGEETQIFGALATGMSDGVFVMPGTHSKWIVVRNGQIVDYWTYMTGEVFGVLCQHTILGTLMKDGPFSEQGFRKGVEAGRKAGSNLLNYLFHVRTLPLFDKMPEDMVADYLSGMLIGAEIQGIAPGLSLNETGVTSVGSSDLVNRYEIALQVFGLKSQRAPEDIVAGGHFAIASAAGLIS